MAEKGKSDKREHLTPHTDKKKVNNKIENVLFVSFFFFVFVHSTTNEQVCLYGVWATVKPLKGIAPLGAIEKKYVCMWILFESFVPTVVV